MPTIADNSDDLGHKKASVPMHPSKPTAKIDTDGIITATTGFQRPGSGSYNGANGAVNGGGGGGSAAASNGHLQVSSKTRQQRVLSQGPGYVAAKFAGKKAQMEA
ncbi:hypothetical protein KEM55_008614, partial [Ascosphaera atra]